MASSLYPKDPYPRNPFAEQGLARCLLFLLYNCILSLIILLLPVVALLFDCLFLFASSLFYFVERLGTEQVFAILVSLILLQCGLLWFGCSPFFPLLSHIWRKERASQRVSGSVALSFLPYKWIK